MNEIRRAAVAGSFYPVDQQELITTVNTLLGSAGKIDRTIKAVIAPHAGYVYSGTLAAQLYKQIDKNISRVVLLGPSHHLAFKGMATCSANFYETPLGLIEIDRVTVNRIAPHTVCLDQAHLNEHSLEVHLPFLQQHLNHFKLVPIVIGDVEKEEVARLIESLWGDNDTLILISSDMSHFLRYDDAKQRDYATSKKILNFDANLTGEEACGCRAINGLLHLAKNKHYKISELSIINSGDTGGDKNRVVGYGAFTLHQTSTNQPTSVYKPARFSLALRQQIIHLARQSILHSLTSNTGFNIELTTYSDKLQAEGASFITINIGGNLRGCIGSLNAHRSLILDVAHNAQAAAFKDPRFPKLTLKEFRDIDIHVSILSEPKIMGTMSYNALLEVIKPGVDGITLEENGRRATYLPSVWKQLPLARDFISSLRQKAGLPIDSWQNCQVECYTTEEFS